jgi:D-sedoheptulose 7-phosphate isomerase
VLEEYVALLRDRLETLDLPAVRRLAGLLREIHSAGRSVYVLGNGGSASVAAHFALSLSYDVARSGASPLAATALSDTATITAIGNDRDFRDVFADQLKPRLRPGDAVVAFSASGASANIVRALEWARTIGAVAVAVTGACGPVVETADLVVDVDCSDPAVAEDVFHVVAHLVARDLVQ